MPFPLLLHLVLRADVVPVQTGCAECVWTVYQRQLLDYERARARAAGQPEPVDPFAALEAQLYGSSQDKQAPEKQPGDDTQSKAS